MARVEKLAHLGPGVAARAVNHGRQIGEDLGAPFDKAHGRQRHVVGRVLVQVQLVDVHAEVSFRIHLIELSVNGDITTDLPEPSTRQ
jgi:hypothetical protein